MVTFEDMLKNLHKEAGVSLEDADVYVDAEGVKTIKTIKITSDRQFEVPEGYNTILAYEGDINSQIVTFELANKHEGHLLAACEFKKLRWSNQSARTEGISDLKLTSEPNDPMILTWTVPPEAFVKAGKLEISISFYDFDKGLPAFAWNTPIFDGFSVGETTQYVGIGLNSTETLPPAKRPAKNEILFIDVENRNIVAPAEYNYVVGNYGDKGVSTVHFQMQRYVHGMDLLGTNTEITIYGYLGEIEFSSNINDVNRYSADGSYGEGLVDFDWNVPDELLENAENYVGNLSISILISQSNDGVITKRWNSSPFLGLVIGESDYDFNNGELPIAIKQYKIVGNKAKEHNGYNEVAGIVQIRDNIETPDIAPEKNELVAEYIDGKFIGLKIGTDEGPVDAGVTEETLYPMIKAYLQSNQLVLNANLFSNIFFAFRANESNYPEYLYLTYGDKAEYGDPHMYTFLWEVYGDEVNPEQEIPLRITSTQQLSPGKYKLTYNCNDKTILLGSVTLSGSVSPNSITEFTIENSQFLDLGDIFVTIERINGLQIELKLERLGN